MSEERSSPVAELRTAGAIDSSMPAGGSHPSLLPAPFLRVGMLSGAQVTWSWDEYLITPHTHVYIHTLHITPESSKSRLSYTNTETVEDRHSGKWHSPKAGRRSVKERWATTQAGDWAQLCHE